MLLPPHGERKYGTGMFVVACCYCQNVPDSASTGSGNGCITSIRVLYHPRYDSLSKAEGYLYA